ncbi:MAG: PIN domain-containing protein [Thermodesulfobacteriota bacterium]
MILVDTSVWSLAFRRRRSGSSEPGEARILRELIEANEGIGLPGIVLQELLSGVRETAQFDELKEILTAFPIIVATAQTHIATAQTHIEAARIANVCSGKGIAISSVDCLIAATTIEQDARLLTSDKDFVYMADHCALRLFESH